MLTDLVRIKGQNSRKDVYLRANVDNQRIIATGNRYGRHIVSLPPLPSGLSNSGIN
jgi:hypothetical protein